MAGVPWGPLPLELSLLGCQGSHEHGWQHGGAMPLSACHPPLCSWQSGSAWAKGCHFFPRA